MIAVLDSVLREIAQEIAAFEPERGGALLGPPGRPFVTRFLSDPGAEVTRASYRPSVDLNLRVKAVEREEGLELKGLVHSHPAGMDHPSMQDAYELGVGLGLNPHMPSYLAPIVTVRRVQDALSDHELPCGRGVISFHAGFRSRGRTASVKAVPVKEVPMLRDLERVRTVFGGEAPSVFLADLGGVEVPAGRLVLDGGLELLLLAGEHYPALPPIVLATPAGGETEQLRIHWPIEVAAEERLVVALRPVLQAPGPYRKAWGVEGGPALTEDEERARIAGWTCRFTGADPAAAARTAHDALFSRSHGIVSRDLDDRTYLVAGVGSVGSFMAEQLVRTGVGGIILVDPDTVDASNLCRTTFELADVGRPKVEALARRLVRISPTVRVEICPRRLNDLDRDEISALLRKADVVVGAMDDPAAQCLLDRHAVGQGRPGVYVALYEGAQGGEVVLSVPGMTPCFLCATRARHQVEESAGRVSRGVDYGSGRLVGEIALGVDIQHVSTAAVKLALSLGLPEGTEARLGGFAQELIAEGNTYLTFSNVPRYWFYPHIFQDAPGQFAWQSVALSPSRHPDCPVCGTGAARIEASDVPMRAPSRSAFLDVEEVADEPSSEP